ncbi:MAG: hypothetical protein ACRDC6_21840 [Shewanella sp.]
MGAQLKMSDLFSVGDDDFGVKMMTALRDGHFIQLDNEDDSMANKLICHAVENHDELSSNLEVTAQALIDSCRDVVNLKKEIERLSLINAEILDSIDESVANNDLQAVTLMRKKYITD